MPIPGRLTSPNCPFLKLHHSAQRIASTGTAWWARFRIVTRHELVSCMHRWGAFHSYHCVCLGDVVGGGVDVMPFITVLLRAFRQSRAVRCCERAHSAYFLNDLHAVTTNSSHKIYPYCPYQPFGHLGSLACPVGHLYSCTCLKSTFPPPYAVTVIRRRNNSIRILLHFFVFWGLNQMRYARFPPSVATAWLAYFELSRPRRSRTPEHRSSAWTRGAIHT